ncbi:DNA phosphorothioation-dependent restriction protein DptG [Aeromonas enteropelogenes]|uniref:DNA phosphorothioation-dependent restriction protein DptG n=1 Tax=Aeromonas enteropelogenes TaxID=29489 RepID=UPI00191FDD21|nr:DNA phosphorothioation-dependent restriction protein DptG [Aeromonas enteropelogenes]MBL0521088.1 DNA phosphorothioation-dependent restriction protein DptG [Aeromonas enteropelogenes]
MSEFPISENLKVANSNNLKNYWPIRNAGNEFNWDTVTGVVLSQVLGKQVKTCDLVDFQEKCKTRFLNRFDDATFWSVLERAYFANGSLYDISPLFLLFKAKVDTSGNLDISASDQRLCKLFAGLLDDFQIQDIDDNLNFVERDILGVLRENLQSRTTRESSEQPYLPFLNQVFREDIQFLSEHPQYLLQALPKMLKLYAFSYCAQLALNITDWEEPKSRPLYFILDSEKASSERTSVKRFGYKLLASAYGGVFPLLSALDVLQRGLQPRPLWQVYRDAMHYPGQAKLLDTLNDYLQAFIENRELVARPRAGNTAEAFEQLKALAIEQFFDVKKTRGDVYKKYNKQLEASILSEFIQARGAAGRTLVLNQDQLLLLTNLTIGKAEKLRLHELCKGFEQRGFYLDNQTLEVLVAFYERMGNVERMSDSGDAVYVRKTL